MDQWYEIGSVITIINAKLEDTLSEEAEYLLASEAANAGCIVLSRSQEASAEEIAKTKAHLNRALQAVHCSRRFENEIIEKNWEDFTEQDLNQIQNSGYCVEDYTKLHFPEKEGFQSVCIMNQEMTRHEMVFSPCVDGQKVVIVIGEELNKQKIESLLEGHA